MRVIGALMGLIFGLFFAGVGGFIALETAVPTYFGWQDMKTWDATEARILEAGGEDNGVTATYRYWVDGKEYQGNRVYLAGFKDNIGSYHKDMRTLLRERRRSGEPVRVWFNPDNPADSVIDREMRWGLFALMTGFCSVFVIIGLAVAVASIKGGTKASAAPVTRLAALRQSWQSAQASGDYNGSFIEYVKSGRHREATVTSEYSDPNLQPWLENPRWKSGRIRSNARRGMYFMWGFAILWNAVGSPILFVLGEELERGNYPALLGLLFPAIGLFLLKKAWNQTREWRRFGVIELELDPFPGAIGGHVGGRLLIRNSYDNASQYNIELACVYSYVSSGGKNRSRHERVLWHEKGVAHATVSSSASGTGTLLSFRFDVPDNLPESDVKQSGDYHLWRLRLKAEMPGVDLDRDYSIPVFRTGDRTSTVQHDLSRQAAANRDNAVQKSKMALSAGQFDQTALARSLRFNDQGGVARFYYPMFRNKLLTLVAFIFAAGFNFAGYSMLTEFGGGLIGILVAIFAVPFILIGLLATLATLYLPLNNLRVAIGNGSLQVTRRLFIVPILRYQVATWDVTRLEVERSGSTGQGTGMVTHYKISAHTKAGKKITIAEDVDGRELADAFQEFLEKRLGISKRRSR